MQFITLSELVALIDQYRNLRKDIREAEEHDAKDLKRDLRRELDSLNNRCVFQVFNLSGTTNGDNDD